MSGYSYTAQSLALDIKLELIIEDLEYMLEEFEGPPPVLPHEDRPPVSAPKPPDLPQG